MQAVYGFISLHCTTANLSNIPIPDFPIILPSLDHDCFWNVYIFKLVKKISKIIDINLKGIES